MKQTNIKSLILSISLVTLTLAACGSSNATPTPTQVSAESIYTQVAATVFAGQTLAAAALPTGTLTPTVTITVTPAPTATSGTPTATQIVYVPPVQPAATAAITATGAVGCNNAAFVEDVTISDKTKIAPGATFTKTWRIKNTGTCTWNGNFKFTFVSGQLFGSDTTKIRRNVAPGATTDFSLSMTAPTTAGTYSSSWRMANENGVLFGSTFDVQIVVPSPTTYP